MICHLYVSVKDKTGPIRYLYRAQELYTAPHVGDWVFWSGDWVGMRVRDRHLSADRIEVYLDPGIYPAELNEWIEAGWEIR